MEDEEEAGTWWQRNRPSTKALVATLVAIAGLLTAIDQLINTLSGCGPS